VVHTVTTVLWKGNELLEKVREMKRIVMWVLDRSVVHIRTINSCLVNWMRNSCNRPMYVRLLLKFYALRPLACSNKEIISGRMDQTFGSSPMSRNRPLAKHLSICTWRRIEPTILTIVQQLRSAVLIQQKTIRNAKLLRDSNSFTIGEDSKGFWRRCVNTQNYWVFWTFVHRPVF
jgi:hypothetical protein